ncbi:MAG: lactate racemization operon protein, partial [Gemmatimonadetes bacterium]|nr:lactate racemization operon protein [Gemmatimonadota bacterium]
GPVRVKICTFENLQRLAPEYEDCAQLARQKNVPIQSVYAAARATLREE